MKKQNNKIYTQLLIKNTDWPKLRDLKADNTIKSCAGWGPSLKTNYTYLINFENSTNKLIDELTKNNIKVYKWSFKRLDGTITESLNIEQLN